MTVQTIQDQVPTTPVQDQEVKEPTVQDQIQDAIKQSEDRWKKEVSGRDRRVSELEKQLQQKELEHLKEDERVKRETEIAIAERDRAKADAEQYQASLIKTKALVDIGLTTDFAKYINGKTEDEIIAQTKEFHALVKKAADATYEKAIKEKLGGTPPIGGSTPGQKIKTLAELNALSPKDRATFMGSGGIIKDE